MIKNYKHKKLKKNCSYVCVLNKYKQIALNVFQAKNKAIKAKKKILKKNRFDTDVKPKYIYL